MWFMVKINWGLYTQLKSTVNSFTPPKETHSADRSECHMVQEKLVAS